MFVITPEWEGLGGRNEGHSMDALGVLGVKPWLNSDQRKSFSPQSLVIWEGWGMGEVS